MQSQMQSLLSVVTGTGRYVTLRPSTVPPASLALPYSRTHTGLVQDITFLVLVSRRTRHCLSFPRERGILYFLHLLC